MKRPLIPVALFYLAGLLLAGFPVPLPALFVIAFALVFLTLFWPRIRLVSLCALIVLAGWINLAQRTAVLSPVDLRIIAGEHDALVSIRGRLRETPYLRVYRDEQRNVDVWTAIAQVDASEIRFGGGEWQPAFGRIMTRTPGILSENVFAGRGVEITGTLQPARGPVAEGLFDYRDYLRHLGIYHQLRARGPDAWQITSGPATAPLADRFCNWARKTLARGLPVEDESLRLEWALTLGWKAALTDEVSEPFVRAATYHIFAVDGLRIAIVSGIFLGLFRVLGIPRAWCGLLAVPIIWFYAAMTGWPASAIRAIVMIMVVFGGWALDRPGDLINSLFAAAIIILVWEPRQLFQAGFQLSFFVVLCIILILPFFKNIGERLLRPDPLLPESLQPRWQKMLREPGRYVLDLFLVSVAAWLGSIALVALYFHLVTPLSGPANVLAVPLCALVLICNLSSLLFGAWLPFVSELFNHAGWFLMECIRATSHWSADWPGAYFYLPMPGLFTILLYYLILTTVLTGWLFRGERRAWKIGGVALLSFVWCGLWLWERPVTRVTVLPLMGGHAVYARLPGGNDWLIDCGGESFAQTVVKPFLRAQGVNRLDNLVLTHGEVSYSGGAKSALDLFRPRNIYLSPVRFRSPGYIEFANEIAANPSLRKPIQAGSRIGPWTVLYPGTARHFSKGEDNALVLRAEIGGTRILLCSGLGHAGQNALFDGNNTNDLRADFVVAGIPAEGEPLSEALLNAVQPRVIVIADSAVKSADADLRARLTRRHVPVFYVSETSAVTLAIRPGHWQANAMDGTRVDEASNGTK